MKRSNLDGFIKESDFPASIIRCGPTWAKPHPRDKSTFNQQATDDRLRS